MLNFSDIKLHKTIRIYVFVVTGLHILLILKYFRLKLSQKMLFEYMYFRTKYSLKI